jgi:SAM-dependent methyltransferase
MFCMAYPPPIFYIEVNVVVDIEQVASGLVEVQDGLWVSKKHSFVSYPEDGMDYVYRLEERSYWFRHRNQCILSVMNHFRPAGTFFDIGGGNGFVSQGVRQLGIETVVVEPDPSGSRHALGRGLKPVIAATIDDADFKAGSMPSAGLFDVIEHIEDDLALLRQMHGLLSDEGKLFITVPAYQWLWSSYDDSAGHFRRYRLASLCDLLRTAGFKVDFATYIFGFIPLPIYLFRRLPERLGLQRTVNLKEDDSAEQYTVDNPLLNFVLNLELSWIRSLRPLPLGGSCLVAAHKPAMIN